jgi:hypothetical protein
MQELLLLKDVGDIWKEVLSLSNLRDAILVEPDLPTVIERHDAIPQTVTITTSHYPVKGEIRFKEWVAGYWSWDANRMLFLFRTLPPFLLKDWGAWSEKDTMTVATILKALWVAWLLEDRLGLPYLIEFWTVPHLVDFSATISGLDKARVVTGTIVPYKLRMGLATMVAVDWHDQWLLKVLFRDHLVGTIDYEWVLRMDEEGDWAAVEERVWGLVLDIYLRDGVGQ